MGRGISLHGLFWKIFARTGPEIQGFKSYLCCVSPFFCRYVVILTENVSLQFIKKRGKIKKYT